MLSILLWGGAAVVAFFLSGCTEGKKTQDTSASGTNRPDSSVSVYIPPDGSTPKPAPTPAPRYLASFGTDLRAADIYQRLQEAKVSDETLDRGCNLPVLLNVPDLQRAKDTRIDACEVYEFALDNYQKYPEITEALTGSPIPWSLDDRNPATVEDNEIRERVKKTVASLQESPGLKKLGMKSDEYRKKLAQALVFFADFPSDPQYLKEHQEELRKQSDVLVGLDLKDFQEELLEKGGLDATRFKEDRREARVGSAIQALAEHRGGAAARAKVLYGILALAELDPVFLFVSQKSNSDSVETFDAKDVFSRLNFSGHKLKFLQVGVRLSDKNPATGRSELLPLQGLQPDVSGGATPQELSLATFLAEDFHEQGDYWLARSKQTDQAMLSYKIALNLNPLDSGIYNSVGVLMESLGNSQQAETAFRESLRFDVTNGLASYNLGRLYQSQGKLGKAVDEYLTTAVFSAGIFERYRDSIEPVVQEVLKADSSNENARGLASKLRELREEHEGKPEAK